MKSGDNSLEGFDKFKENYKNSTSQDKKEKSPDASN